MFGVAHLRYAEIGDVAVAIEGLRGKGFLSGLSREHYLEWLCTLKKDALVLIGREAGREEVKASWKKSKLIDFIVERLAFEDALATARDAALSCAPTLRRWSSCSISTSAKRLRI